MKLDLSRHAPPGLDLAPELRVFTAGMALSALFSLLFYAVRYSDRLEQLYWKNGAERTLIPGAVMPDFAEVLGQALIGFLIVAVCMAAFAAVHYSCHYQKSKSIYTMRRLPNRWELHRRCLTLPLAGLAASLLAAFLLLLVYYAAYMLITPDTCLTPDQWRKIWSVTP